MIRRKNPAMPTPPRTYSSAAAEKLRLAILALAATAVAGCDRVETALGFRTTGVIGPPVPATSEPATVSESDDIILGGEPPIEPAAIDTPDALVRGEPPMMPVPSTNAPSSAPIPIELTEADLKKLEAAGFDVSTAIHAATNAPSREAGSVPEASASGSVLVPTNRIILLGGLRTFH